MPELKRDGEARIALGRYPAEAQRVRPFTRGRTRFVTKGRTRFKCFRRLKRFRRNDADRGHAYISYSDIFHHVQSSTTLKQQHPKKKT